MLASVAFAFVELAFVELVLASVELLPLEQRLRSIEDRERGPCRPSNHHDKLLFRIGCKRKRRASWDGSNIGLVVGL